MVLRRQYVVADEVDLLRVVVDYGEVEVEA